MNSDKSNRRPSDDVASRLESALEDLETFHHLISHDLRSTLGAILNYAVLLREDCGHQLGSQGGEYVERIDRNARRAVGLLDKLVRFSSLDDHRLDVSIIDLRGCLENCVESRPRDSARNSVRIIGAELPHVEADRSLMRLAIDGIVQRGLEALQAEKEPTIHVGGERGDGHVSFTFGFGGPSVEAWPARELRPIFLPPTDGCRNARPSVEEVLACKAIQRMQGSAQAGAPAEGTSLIRLILPVRARAE